jgi:hypothetical protein
MIKNTNEKEKKVDKGQLYSLLISYPSSVLTVALACFFLEKNNFLSYKVGVILTLSYTIGALAVAIFYVTR